MVASKEICGKRVAAACGVSSSIGSFSARSAAADARPNASSLPNIQSAPVFRKNPR